jgi:general secretion pathway protein D
MRSRVFICVVFSLLLAVPVLAESAASAFNAGQHAEKKNDYDTAYQAYKKAHDTAPQDAKYMAAYLRMRFYASSQHIHAGQTLRDEGKEEEALTEFRLASQIDPSNFEAQGQVHRSTQEIQKKVEDKAAGTPRVNEETALDTEAKSAAGPVVLDFKSDFPVSIQMTATTDVIYKTIGKLGGFNILIDPEYKPLKITFELKDVTVREALNMLGVQSKTFWRPLSSNTIMVAADNSGKRKELEQNVMKTFYLRNAATPADLQQAAGTLKGILDISHIQVTPELRSLTIRGTPDQMVLAERLLNDIDKPKSEVVIEVVVMEVSRDRIRTLGANLPTSVSASIAPGGSSTSGGTGGGLTLNSFSGLGASDIAVSVGGASFTALASDSNTKVIQRPNIRVMDSEKASLKIGDRIPIATGSFQSGLTQGVNTQFQYIDVGVKIDITPYVHAGNDVTLKMSLEVSSVTGEQSIDGVTEPTIGQRTIDHEARLADGEVNLIAGILNDTETQSMSGYPLLSKIPILKYFFAQENKEKTTSEIVFAIIPHVIRTPGITDDNLKMVDLGTANSVTYRKAAVKADAAATLPPGSQPQPADKPATAPALRPQINR